MRYLVTNKEAVMAKAKTIFPARPTTEVAFSPPTEAERAAFAAKLVECCANEVDGHEHRLVRLVYAVKHIEVTETRREELHRHLWMFEGDDDHLIKEAEALATQINTEMSKSVPPKTKTALEDTLEVMHLPKDVFVQRYMDNKVGKLSATFTEFEKEYVVVDPTPIPKEL